MKLYLVIWSVARARRLVATPEYIGSALNAPAIVPIDPKQRKPRARRGEEERRALELFLVRGHDLRELERHWAAPPALREALC